MNYSLIAVTIPMARVLLANLVTHYGGIGCLTASDSAYASGSKKQSSGQTSDAIHMDTLQSSVSHKSRNTYDSQPHTSVSEHGTYKSGISSSRGHRAEVTTAVSERESEAVSVVSNESQKMIIRKDMSYRVGYET